MAYTDRGRQRLQDLMGTSTRDSVITGMVMIEQFLAPKEV